MTTTKKKTSAKEKKDDVKIDNVQAASAKEESKKEEKEKVQPKDEELDLIETVEELENMTPAEKKGDREVIAVNPANGRATLHFGGRTVKVKCYPRRSDGAKMIGIKGKSVVLEDWLEGRADLV